MLHEVMRERKIRPTRISAKLVLPWNKTNASFSRLSEPCSRVRSMPCYAAICRGFSRSWTMERNYRFLDLKSHRCKIYDSRPCSATLTDLTKTVPQSLDPRGILPAQP